MDETTLVYLIGVATGIIIGLYYIPPIKKWLIMKLLHVQGDK